MTIYQGQHYILIHRPDGMRSYTLTEEGQALTYWERRQIDISFFTVGLGERIDLIDTLPEIWEADIESESKIELSPDEKGSGDDPADEGREARWADDFHDRGREHYLAGVDSIEARYYERSRGR